jgi:Tfp pilus assembly protein PilF
MSKTVGLSYIWQSITITILIVAAYFPTFSGDFVLDDIALIKNNPFIREPHSLPEYLDQEDGVIDQTHLGEYHSGYYRPLINMTYRLDYKIWGNDAVGFRITNLVLHILFSLFLFFFISRYVDRQIAFWITLIFALHPVNTESVSVITSRNNIIAALLILVSLWSYITGWERNKISAYIVSLLLFIGAVFSKEFGLMVIPLIFLYQRTLARQKYGLSKELISYIPFLMLVFFYMMLREGVTDSILTPSSMDNIWSRIYFTPFIIFYNLKLILLPHGLHCIQVNYPANVFNWYSTLSVLVFILIGLSLWKLKSNRLLIFSILGFLVCIFPALNIIPNSSISLVGMRWLYVSMGFLLIGISSLIQKVFAAKRDISISILVIIITYLGGYTYILNRGLWHDNDTLIQQEVFGFKNYLFASDIAEKYFNNKQYSEAEKLFKVAIEKASYQAYSYINLAALYIETGRPEVAVSVLNKAKRLVMTNHEQGEWYNNMGTALINMGEIENGLKNLRKSVISVPDEDVFWANLGGAYGMTGDYVNSINALKTGIEISPESILLRINLALTYINLKDYQQAISILEAFPEKELKGNPEVLRLIRQAQVGQQNDGSGLDRSKK